MLILLRAYAHGGKLMSKSRTGMRKIREALGVTQEDVTKEVSGLRLTTYVRAENGKGVTFNTAKMILQAFNQIAARKGMHAYRLEDLDL